MSWENGKRSKTGTPIRNGIEDKQIVNAMRAFGISATPENRDKARQAIGGVKRTNKEVSDIVKALFEGENETEPSA